MGGLILRFLLSAASLGLMALIVRGVHADGIGPLLLTALVLGILNEVVRPVLWLLTLPSKLLTLGLFTFVLNAGMLGLASKIVPGFHVDSIVSALLGAVVLAVVSAILNWLVHDAREKKRD